jgi:O-antigen biosynthesis protein
MGEGNGCALGLTAGWYLLEWQHPAPTEISPLTLRLYGGQGEVCDLPLALTMRGRLRMVVEIPFYVVTARLSLHNLQGDVAKMAFTPLESWQRHLRILASIIVALWRQPWRRLGRLGLTLPLLLREPYQAYRLILRLYYWYPEANYREWLSRHASFDPSQAAISAHLCRLRRQSSRWQWLIFAAEGDRAAHSHTRQSIKAQWLSATAPGVVRSVDDLAVIDASAEWLLLLPAGVGLYPWALYWMAAIEERQPSLQLIYADHDVHSLAGVPGGFAFKPDWSPELLRGIPYLGPLLAVRRERLVSLLSRQPALIAAMGGHRWQLALSEGLCTHEVGHIAFPLYHLPLLLAKQLEAGDRLAVVEHLQRLDVKAEVAIDRHGTCQVRYLLMETPPLVSIIIPTRDRRELLQTAVDGVLQRTTYPSLEVIIVDNGSRDAAALSYLAEVIADRRVRVVRDDGPFNYAAINNRAVAAARGELVCLLNNDTEVIHDDWLSQMVALLQQQPQVAVVGAKLLYGNGRVQHGGDVIGVGGLANHLHHRLPADAPGYMRRAIVAQDLSAVTAACLMTRRSVWMALGGLNEHHLAVTFNDIDYCLRVIARGWRVVWTPQAVLYHHESLSRKGVTHWRQRRQARCEAAWMRRRWRQYLRDGDPLYSPNLSQQRADLSLSHAPMVVWPWQLRVDSRTACRYPAASP